MKVTNGNIVEVHYKGTFANGEVFDDSRSRGTPFTVIVGQGQVIKGFENALFGMSKGQTKNVNLTADEAYGQPDPNAVMTVSKEQFPADYVFENGTMVHGAGGDGRPVLAKIVSSSEQEVVLDMNHPLAGKDINFEIELLDITDGADTTDTTENG